MKGGRLGRREGLRRGVGGAKAGLRKKREGSSVLFRDSSGLFRASSGLLPGFFQASSGLIRNPSGLLPGLRPKSTELRPDCPESSFCGAASMKDCRSHAVFSRSRPAKTIFWTIRVRLRQFWPTRRKPKLKELGPDCLENSFCGTLSSRLRKFTQSARNRPAETFFWTIRARLRQF